MVKHEIKKIELVWPQKYDKNVKTVEGIGASFPFQIIERVNETQAAREAHRGSKQTTLFEDRKTKEDNPLEKEWKNMLICGENEIVLRSLAEQFAGKLNLIYIDPPFATGVDYSYTVKIGEEKIEVPKDQSLLEERAYRDTWGEGLESYLNMMKCRLILLHKLLADDGTIYVHLDWHVVHYIKIIMDEIFGAENFLREIVWSIGTSSGFKAQVNLWVRGHDSILMYKKGKIFTFNKQFLDLDERTIRRYDKKDENGKRYKIYYEKDGSERRVYLETSKGRPMTDTWTDIIGFQTVNRGDEYLDYQTQKPEILLERIISASSYPGDIVLDCFCGSGTTLAVAERLGRRWIGCDFGRLAIHTTRKRLMKNPDCKPFDIVNLGKYERQIWQEMSFGGKDQPNLLYKYYDFILKLYDAKPISGFTSLHGMKGNAFIHIGNFDATITVQMIREVIKELDQTGIKELHVLGWEWEMGIHDLMESEAKSRGIKLILKLIPNELMEIENSNLNGIRFFDLACLNIKTVVQRNKIIIELQDFIIPNVELIPENVRAKITKWVDYVDYWAIDFDFKNDTFVNNWTSFRTKQDRSLKLISDPHEYQTKGKHEIMIKVIDIFGIDTSVLKCIET